VRCEQQYCPHRRTVANTCRLLDVDASLDVVLCFVSVTSGQSETRCIATVAVHSSQAVQPQNINFDSHPHPPTRLQGASHAHAEACLARISELITTAPRNFGACCNLPYRARHVQCLDRTSSRDASVWWVEDVHKEEIVLLEIRATFVFSL
jgi:hypothetical protein